jgi:hypothetical protein
MTTKSLKLMTQNSLKVTNILLNNKNDFYIWINIR